MCPTVLGEEACASSQETESRRPSSSSSNRSPTLKLWVDCQLSSHGSFVVNPAETPGLPTCDRAAPDLDAELSEPRGWRPDDLDTGWITRQQVSRHSLVRKPRFCFSHVPNLFDPPPNSTRPHLVIQWYRHPPARDAKTQAGRNTTRADMSQPHQPADPGRRRQHSDHTAPN